MSTTITTPIACTLAPSAFRDRIDRIKVLAAKSLRGHHRDGLALNLTYEPDVAAEIRELVRGERECCSFLRFDLQEGDDAVRLTITAPPGARDAAEELFAHFVS
jgi:hypothetical protein